MHHERRHIRRLAAGILSATVAISSCGGGNESAEVTDATSPAVASRVETSDATSLTSSAVTDTTAAAATTTAPDAPAPTSASTTTPPRSEPASSATPEPSVTGSIEAQGRETDPATSTPPPTTPAPERLASIVFVDPDQPTRSASVFGFEYATFVEPDAVVSTIGAALDQPDHDTGWQAMPSSIACKGDLQYRSILWDDLRVVLERRDDRGGTRLGAWSVGEVPLSFSPPLAAKISEASGVTSASGLGIGASSEAIAEEGFPMVGVDGDRTLALSGISPVVFEIGDGTVTAFSIEDNDCLAGTDDS